MKKSKLQLQQIDQKIQFFVPLKDLVVPQTGWIKAIRNALGMSMSQLGEKLSITRQSVKEIELREQEGSISIKSLREAGRAMDMELVYGFVPKDGSLEALVNRKAFDLAKKIVLSTSNTMSLEDQENSKDRINKAIEERTQVIVNKMPKILWD